MAGIAVALLAAAGAGGAQADAPAGGAPAPAPHLVVSASTQQAEVLHTQLRRGRLADGHGVAQLCGDHHLHCRAQAVTTAPGSHALLTSGRPIGYGAGELQRAYGVSATGTTGTVAVVGSGAYPTLEADLATYRATYGLPRCTTASGCLRVVGRTGGRPLRPTKDAFGRLVEEAVAVETALDVDMASAACPRCRIVVVQVPWQDAAAATPAQEDAATAHFATGVKTAVRLGAKAVSISYGYDTDAYDLTGAPAQGLRQPGVAVFASSGDSGFLGDLGQWPQSLPTVISVGGTSLYPSATARGYTDVAWGGSGSGCTPGVGPANGQPADVSAACGGSRAASDVSAVADPTTGVAVYDSYAPASGSPYGFLVAGGTSASSPFLAGLAARAGVPATTLGPNTVYAAPASTLIDVTLGQNAPAGVCRGYGFDPRLCVAGTGWDGPTGRGVPDGKAVFAAR